MDRKTYPKFVRDLRRAWVPGQGVIAEMKSQDAAYADVRVCGSCVDNKGLVLEVVKVWDGDDMLWMGSPASADLKRLLNDLRCCGARFCTARSTGDKSCLRCYKPTPTAVCAACDYRNKQEC